MRLMEMHKQLIKHDPINGKWGDCFRTSIAIVIGETPERVPHFCDGPDATQGGAESARNWLRPSGRSIFTTYYPPDLTLAQIAKTISAYAPDVPAIITGKGVSGVNHSVVILGGAVFCDPSTGEANQKALVGPAVGSDGDSWWWVEVIAALPTPANGGSE